MSMRGDEEMAIAAVPLQRMGTTDDIAWLAMFLADGGVRPFPIG